MPADRLQDIVDWLAGGTRSASRPAEAHGELCKRILACGIPVWRVGLFIRTLHPDVFGSSFIWRQGKEVEIGRADFTLPDTEEFQTSPLHEAIATQKMVRHRLTLNEPLNSSVLEGLRAEGITDYLAFPLPFMDGSVHVISTQTKQLTGFSDEDIAALERLMPPLARIVEINTLRLTAATLLRTYVGNRSGERILAGQIRRGHTETLHAAIWLSDLRGFTALADRLPPQAVAELLNRYFDCQVPLIQQAGGEVLKFMGDGLLAIFAVADAAFAPDAAGRALEAAKAAIASVDDLQGSPVLENEPVPRMCVSIHFGDIFFGNIGAIDRLDFTAIGPAVNLLGRLDQLTKRLERRILVTDDFARVCPHPLRSVGTHPLRGLSEPHEIFTPADSHPEPVP